MDNSRYFIDIFERRFKKIFGSGAYSLDDKILSNKKVLDVIQGMGNDGTKEIAKYIYSNFKSNKINNIAILGAGSGKMGDHISKHFPKSNIVEIDKSEPVVKRLKSISRNNYYRTALLADARNIPQDKKYDLIIAYSILRYVDDRSKVIDSIKHVLSLNGSAVIVEARMKEVVDDLEKILITKKISYKTHTIKDILLCRTSYFYFLINEAKHNKLLRQKIDEKVEPDKSFIEAALDCAGKYKSSLYFLIIK
jgi:trans-aconitate methyltransferase